LPSHAPQEELK